MSDGNIKVAFYPCGVVLQFENGYSLHPSHKTAAKWLRGCADDIEAQGEAFRQNHPLLPIFQFLDEAGLKPFDDSPSSAEPKS